jgi:hypothetical protein
MADPAAVNGSQVDRNGDFTSETFYAALSRFLEREESANYQRDIRLNASGHVTAFKMTMRIRKLGELEPWNRVANPPVALVYRTRKR